MNEIYRNGNIFPDEFYKKYTNFNSHNELIKTAKKLGIEIKLTKTLCNFSVKNDLNIIDDFIKENTNFQTWDEFIKNGQTLYKEIPSLLPKTFVKGKFAASDFIARDNYELQCNYCRNKITIEKNSVIPKCNCSSVAHYVILKIF